MGSREAPLPGLTHSQSQVFSISDRMSGQEERSGGLVETQPFRNASMVQAEPKSILSFVEQIGSNNLITTATSGDPNPKAYRNNPTCLAEPMSIWNIDEKGNSEAKKLITPASGGPDKNAYRTNPLLLPEAKSIYSLEDTGNKFLQPSGDPDERAYRTSPLVYAEPKLNNGKYVTSSGAPEPKAFRTN